MTRVLSRFLLGYPLKKIYLSIYIRLSLSLLALPGVKIVVWQWKLMWMCGCWAWIWGGLGGMEEEHFSSSHKFKSPAGQISPRKALNKLCCLVDFSHVLLTGIDLQQTIHCQWFNSRMQKERKNAWFLHYTMKLMTKQWNRTLMRRMFPRWTLQRTNGNCPHVSRTFSLITQHDGHISTLQMETQVVQSVPLCSRADLVGVHHDDAVAGNQAHDRLQPIDQGQKLGWRAGGRVGGRDFERAARAGGFLRLSVSQLATPHLRVCIRRRADWQSLPYVLVVVRLQLL